MGRFVALKIIVSETPTEHRELQILQILSRSSSSQPGYQHIVQLLDNFYHIGPNGTHACLVFELLGPSISTINEHSFVNGRLPGSVANRVCKEVLLAVDFLHEQGIGHGGQSSGSHVANVQIRAREINVLLDLHVNNIVFTMPSLYSVSEEILMERLGRPQTGLVRCSEGRPLKQGMPQYLVWSADFPMDKPSLDNPIKLIDFGESFLPSNKPGTLHTPLALRAPELLLEDEWNIKTDLWTLGCTVGGTDSSQSKLCLIETLDVRTHCWTATV